MSLALRAQVSECFERAALPHTPREEKQKLLSFVICGGCAFFVAKPHQPHVLIMPGSPCHQHTDRSFLVDGMAVTGEEPDWCFTRRRGPTGVEVAAELHDMIQEDLRKIYPDLMQDVTIRLIELQVPSLLCSGLSELHLGTSHWQLACTSALSPSARQSWSAWHQLHCATGSHAVRSVRLCCVITVSSVVLRRITSSAPMIGPSQTSPRLSLGGRASPACSTRGWRRSLGARSRSSTRAFAARIKPWHRAVNACVMLTVCAVFPGSQRRSTTSPLEPVCGCAALPWICASRP